MAKQAVAREESSNILDGMYYNVKEDGVVRKTSVYGLIGIDMQGIKEV
jgi:transposase-like protein